MARGDEPFKVLKSIRENAHKLELLGDMNISSTFNIGDLSRYFKDECDFGDWKENPSKMREFNEE